MANGKILKKSLKESFQTAGNHCKCKEFEKLILECHFLPNEYAKLLKK